MKRDNNGLQLSMVEPEGAEAVALLSTKLAEAKKHADLASRFAQLGMRGAAASSRRAAAAAEDQAIVFAILLDLEAEAGL